MKMIFLIPLTVALIFLGACKSQQPLSPVTDNSEMSKKMASNEVFDIENDPCSFGERQTILLICNESAKIVKRGDQYLLALEGENKGKYLPCNLPAALQIEGIGVIFDGKAKKVEPNEMWLGHPLQLTRISKK